MKLTFVGTGSGKTSLYRYHSSLYFESGKGNLLVDAGDSVSRALLANNIKFNDIQNIIITHNHPDHLGGLPSLLNQMKLTGRKQALNIYLFHDAVESISNLLQTQYLFEEKLPFKLNVIPFDNNTNIDLENSIKITPLQNSHITPQRYPSEYSSLPFYSISMFLECDETKIFYSSDVGKIDDLTSSEFKSPDLLILESTHISPEEIMIAFEHFSPRQLLITHIDDETESLLENWRNFLSPEHKESVKIAYDGLIIY